MASVLAAIGSWISGVAVPAITKFFVDGVAIIGSLISSPFLLLIGLTIAVITVAVILYFSGFFNTIKNDYKEVQLIDEKKILNDLNQHKDQAAHVGVNLTYFEKKLNQEVSNYIDKENIKDDEKKNTMHVFIGYVLSLVTNVTKKGINNDRKSLDLFNQGTATFALKYDKNSKKITLNFVFYDDKIFYYLKVLLKILREKGYELEKNNYENEINNFHIEEDEVNKFQIIIKNI